MEALEERNQERNEGTTELKRLSYVALWLSPTEMKNGIKDEKVEQIIGKFMVSVVKTVLVLITCEISLLR